MKWSKENKAFAAAVVLTISLFPFFGCKETSPGSDISADLSTVLILSTVSYDFGMVEAEAGSDNLTVDITNDGSETVTLSQLLLSDPVNFSCNDAVLPITLPPGESVSLNCSFHPVESGNMETAMEIAADGFDTNLEVVLTGEGNYPPTIASGMMVYDADPAIAGFYCPDGVLNGRTLYRSIENPQYMLFFHDYFQKWLIHVNLEIESYYYAVRFQSPRDKFVYQTPDLVATWSETFTDVCDNLSGPVISGADLSHVSPKETIVQVYYFFCDIENDAEDSSLFTWYRCISMEDPGTIMEGVTGKDYTIQGDDLGYHIRVEMVPCASSGIRDGCCTVGPASTLIEVGDLPSD